MSEKDLPRLPESLGGTPADGATPPDPTNTESAAESAPRSPFRVMSPTLPVHPSVAAAAKSTQMKRWSSDPAAFARDIGVHLSPKEERVLRRSMKGVAPNGKKGRRVLEAVRKKLEDGLQKKAREEAQAAPPAEQHPEA